MSSIFVLNKTDARNKQQDLFFRKIKLLVASTY